MVGAGKYALTPALPLLMDYEHDAFVVWADDVDEWVDLDLLPQLDGLRIWTTEEFTPGRYRLDEYADAIAKARYTLLVLSDSWADSRWSQWTQRLALSDSINDGDMGQVLPLLVHDVSLPTYLAGLQPLDCRTQQACVRSMAQIRRLFGFGARSPRSPNVVSQSQPYVTHREFDRVERRVENVERQVDGNRIEIARIQARLGVPSATDWRAVVVGGALVGAFLVLVWLATGGGIP